MSTPHTPAPPPIGATIHIYRGLMDRATTWRVRIDAPTNWAIVTSGASVSFVLGDPIHSHVVLLLVMAMMNAFLLIEARRTRYYDLWSCWVRLLETEYFVGVLRDGVVTTDATWQRMMLRDIDYPHFKSSLRRTLGRRLRDNYLAIHAFLLLAWLLKLLVHERADLPLDMVNTFVNRASIGPIPGVAVLVGVACCYLVLLGVMLFAEYSHEPAIEVASGRRLLQRLSSPTQRPVRRLRADDHDHAPLRVEAGDEAETID